MKRYWPSWPETKEITEAERKAKAYDGRGDLRHSLPASKADIDAVRTMIHLLEEKVDMLLARLPPETNDDPAKDAG